MRVHNFGYREAFKITLLLDCDIIEAAARSADHAFSARIEALLEQLATCRTGADQIRFEIDLRETLLKFVKRPLLELLAHVAWQLYQGSSTAAMHTEAIDLEAWRKGRKRILHAINEGDDQLASFEAQRYRRMVLEWLYRETGEEN